MGPLLICVTVCVPFTVASFHQRGFLSFTVKTRASVVWFFLQKYQADFYLRSHAYFCGILECKMMSRVVNDVQKQWWCGFYNRLFFLTFQCSVSVWHSFIKKTKAEYNYSMLCFFIYLSYVHLTFERIKKHLNPLIYDMLNSLTIKHTQFSALDLV